MGRVACCEKMGMKKGPWTPQEDQILVSFIHQFGHSNWRALPKLAGLLRCGKSCRLRWINYLRPDIKRGNFSPEEQQTIITLHRNLGNRWSAIAAKLPGRTDNEVKNYWHTHLKKRIRLNNTNNNSSTINSGCPGCSPPIVNMSEEAVIFDGGMEESVNFRKEQFCSVVDDSDYWFNLFLQAAAGSSAQFNAMAD